MNSLHMPTDQVDLPSFPGAQKPSESGSARPRETVRLWYAAPDSIFALLVEDRKRSRTVVKDGEVCYEDGH